MGISPSMARAILQEHKYRPIDGNVVLIGRQSMGFTPEEALRVCIDEGVQPRVTRPSELPVDNTTRAANGKGFISDVGFFSLFTDATVTAIDVTDYEGAEIIHDMHDPIPANLESMADFLWIGSCLDNMCDPITALQNSVRMLKPGGRLIDMEIGVPEYSAYLIFSPEYFFDFFAVNSFADCRIYACLFDKGLAHGGPWHFYALDDFAATLGAFPYRRIPRDSVMVTYVVAEMGPDTTWNRKPVQGQYRPDDTVYQRAFEQWSQSPRPLLVGKRGRSLPRSIAKRLPRRWRPMPSKLRGFRYLGAL